MVNSKTNIINKYYLWYKNIISKRKCNSILDGYTELPDFLAQPGKKRGN